MKTNFTTVLVAAIAINLHAAGAVTPPNRPVSKRSTVIMNHSFATKNALAFFDLPPAPVISYASPQIYSVGTQITPLPQTNTGEYYPNATYGAVVTVAGSGTAGFADGPGTLANFNHPSSISCDLNFNKYIADAGNNRIRFLSSDGNVTTYAGTGVAGDADGAKATATFRNPTSVAFGNFIYVCDQGNNKIRKISGTGVVTTLAGSGAAGSDNGRGTAASFNAPYGIALDAAGNLYVSDFGNNKIRKVTPAGVVTDVAGAGTHGFTDGTAAAAHFDGPLGLSVDGAGNVYVADSKNNAIRKITPGKVVTTLAGHLTAGSADGNGANARFNMPYSTLVDHGGNIFVTDAGNNLIRKVTPAGVVTTLAGSGAAAITDGVGAGASFNYPVGISVDNDDNLFISEYNGNVIRQVNCLGFSIVTPFPPGLSFSGYGDGTLQGTPTTPSVATKYIVKAYNLGGSGSAGITIRVNSVAPPIITYPATTYAYNAGSAISPAIPTNAGGNIPSVAYGQTSTLAGSGATGSGNGTGTAATFNHPYAAVTDAAGNVYIADGDNNLIRKITPGGAVTTFAGSGAAGYADGTGAAAIFNNPTGITIDGSGNLYVSDNGNNRIRKITPSRVVTTLAGSGAVGAANGTGLAASFNAPYGIAADAAGNIFVSEFGNCKIRKVTPAGVVTDLAGAGTHGFTNGTGAAARFNSPLGLSADINGNLYVADSKNNAIRKVTPDGVVTTFAGHAAAGNTNGAGTAAAFNTPYGTAVDASGNVFVTDALNNLIRKITPAGLVSTFAGGAAGNTNGIGSAASFNQPVGIAGDLYGNLYITEYTNNIIRKLSVTGYSVSPALPAGLSLNPTTGIITGTPAAATASANYVVTGYSAGGSSPFTVKIAVGNAITTAPHIRYSPTTVTFNAGTTITPLKPINAGGAVPAAAYGRLTHVAGNIIPGSANGTGAAATFSSPTALATDATGNIYVSDAGNRLIRKIDPTGAVTTIAGPAISGISFSNSHGITADASGNVYASEISTNSRIFKVPAGGAGTVYTGGTTGNTDGQVPNATFNKPYGMVTDAQGNIFVADAFNSAIREITPAGVVSHVAVSGLQHPEGITIDPSGNLFVYDDQVKTVFKIVGNTATGIAFNGDVSGGGVATDRAGNVYTSGTAAINRFSPAGGAATPIANVKASALTTDATGSLYAIVGNSIDKIETQGYAISPALPAGLAFDATTGIISGTPEAGAAAANYTITAYNGIGSSATMINITVNAPNPPNYSLPSSSYTFYVGQPITPIPVTNSGSPVVPTQPDQTEVPFVGSQIDGSTNGTGASASFKAISSMALDASGNLFIAEAGNNLIRKTTPAGVVTTFAGSGVAGSADGITTAASFNSIKGIAIDKATGIMYVADEGNHKIRKITPDGIVSTLAGSGASGTANGTGTAATFANFYAICVGLMGNIYVVDGTSTRQITPAGVVTTFNSTIEFPMAIATDAKGNFYVGGYREDEFSGSFSTVYKMSPDGSQVKDIYDYYDFYYMISIAADPFGNVYTVGHFEDDGEIDKIGTDGLFITGLDYIPVVSAVAADGTGTIYASSAPLNSSQDVVSLDGVNNVVKINLAVSKFFSYLPGGLTFDGVAGTISGTPLYLQNYHYYVGGVNALGSNIVNFNVLIIAPPPAISYANSPYRFETAKAITPVSPTNSGGAVPATGYGTPFTFAGTGAAGATNDFRSNATFNSIANVAFDANGNMYVADAGNNLVRKITTDGTTTTFAGSGAAGSADGQGTAASFKGMTGVAVDQGTGIVYVADAGNFKLRKITPDGLVSTLAGSGTAGTADGTGAAATFTNIGGLCVDNAGNIYMIGQGLRKITPAGVVTTIAAASNFELATDVALAPNNNFYVNGIGFSQETFIYLVTPAGVVTTFKSFGGSVNHLASDILGNLYDTEDGGVLRKTLPDGTMSTIAVQDPTTGMAIDGSGNVYAGSKLITADDGNLGDVNTIVRISTSGYSVTPALPAGLTLNSGTGVISGTPTTVTPNNDYTVTAYNFAGQSSATINIGVNFPPPVINYSGTPYAFVKDQAVTPVTPVNSGGAVPANVYAQVTTIAGSGVAGSVDGAATAASFSGPSGVAPDAFGNLLVADYFNNMIRKIAPDGTVKTIAGSTTPGSADGEVTFGKYFHPSDFFKITTRNLYIADEGNNKIRTIQVNNAVGSNSTSTYAGTGAAGDFNNSDPFSVTFNQPRSLVVAPDGSLYIADAENNIIRKITSNRVTTNFAGTTTVGSADGTGAAAGFNHPSGIRSDALGNLFVADAGNNLIRKITPAGVVTTFAGSGAAGSADGTGTAASFNNPQRLAIDPIGNIFVSDGNNSLIRKITPSGVVTTLAGTGAAGAVNGVGTSASFNNPAGLYVDGDVNIFIADKGNNLIRKITATGYTISPALPAGMTFDATTGTIGGTPTTTSPATTYTITAYNKGGSSTASISLQVAMSSMVIANNAAETPIVGEPVVHQLLSPNGDGNNDVLIIENIDQYPTNKVAIMDVNGTLVYQIAGYGANGKAFDGHSSVTGKMQNPGTYFYQLEYSSPTGAKRKAGYFVIKY